MSHPARRPGFAARIDRIAMKTMAAPIRIIDHSDMVGMPVAGPKPRSTIGPPALADLAEISSPSAKARFQIPCF